MVNIVMKKCIFCGEDIEAGIRRCPYCASLLKPSERRNLQETPGNMHEIVDIYIGDALKTDETSYNNTDDPVMTYKNMTGRKPLSNGMKVLLTVICTIVPGLGQLAGVIIAITFMNTEDDADRMSFGTALLVSSLVTFAISIVLLFVLMLASYRNI